MNRYLTIGLLLGLGLTSPAQAAESIDWRALERQGVQSFYRRDFSESAKKLQRSLDQAEAEGVQFPDFSLLRAIRFLAESYERTGEIDPALRTYTYLLAYYEEILGPNHPDVNRVNRTIQTLLRARPTLDLPNDRK